MDFSLPYSGGREKIPTLPRFKANYKLKSSKGDPLAYGPTVECLEKIVRAIGATPGECQIEEHNGESRPNLSPRNQNDLQADHTGK